MLAGLNAHISVVQDVEALREGGHDAVLDAVVHHLDEVTRAGGSAVQIALLLRCQLTRATRRPLNLAHSRSDRLQDRVDDLDRFVVSAHHQAVAALQAEDASAGADVDVMEALLAKLGGPAYVVAIVGVATVNDDVALIQQPRQLFDHLARDASGDHDPDRAGPLQLADKLP